MTANVDIVGEKRAKVLTVPVEAIFKKDETEVVYVKKPEEPKKKAESSGFISSVLAAGKKDAPAAKLEAKDAWKEKFEAREIETGLASVDKVEVVKGLAAGAEVAVEDPTRPKEKKGNE
ncbi:MAG: hypothetical protein U0599_24620 [Vicinamibacteria bacterium]